MFAHPRAIFIEGDIAHPMEPVFDRPMAPAQFEQPLGSGLVGFKTGDAIDRFGAEFLTDYFGDIAPDGKDLCGMREVKITGQLGAAPDRAQFQTAMSFIDGGVLRGEKI